MKERVLKIIVNLVILKTKTFFKFLSLKSFIRFKKEIYGFFNIYHILIKINTFKYTSFKNFKVKLFSKI